MKSLKKPDSEFDKIQISLTALQLLFFQFVLKNLNLLHNNFPNSKCLSVNPLFNMLQRDI